MPRTYLIGTLVAGAVAAMLGCGDRAPSPASPSAAGTTDTAANPDGSSLKATAPTPQSPPNGHRFETPPIVLTVGNSATHFASGAALTYRFEVFNSAGARVYESSPIPGGSGGSTSHEVQAALEPEQNYTWQVRPEYLGVGGPASERRSFTSPVGGYIRGSEVYDPLINGTTVGQRFGSITFVPGVGARLESLTSFIRYHIQTLTSGEFSLLVTNMPANTEGAKTKVLSMSDGDHDMTTNRRRFTIEKRGHPPGLIAWRVITSADQIETFGPAERPFFNFQANQTYFFKATWGSGNFHLLIREGGANGGAIYNQGKPYNGVYDPRTHFAHVGAPFGRAGPPSGSVEKMIARQVWVSNRPRPSFANR
jgi:hypothetical protein